MRILISLVAISLAVGGCQFLGFDSDDTDDHREHWARQHDGTYAYTIMRGCFCALGGQFRVRVEDFEVAGADDLFREQPVDTAEYRYIETIEDLFDLIDRARRDGADELEVEYAPAGYPRIVNIDWYKQAVDDEMFLEVSDVVIGGSNDG